MIRIRRLTEPPALKSTRARELERVRNLISKLKRAPTSDEIGTQYQVVSKQLWQQQAYKCCYCELKEQNKRNDVEHFRPKSRAVRAPGSDKLHGYWWLAWSWKNLFFSCRNCNQAPAKFDRFPLSSKSVLEPEEQPEGLERPLLINPLRESGLTHIQFRPNKNRWIPVARGGSKKGEETIKTCQLDRDDLLDLYAEHVATHVDPRVIKVKAATANGLLSAWNDALTLLEPSMPLVALTWDVLDFHFPLPWRRPRKLTLPENL